MSNTGSSGASYHLMNNVNLEDAVVNTTGLLLKRIGIFQRI